jgi:hypothetical protein
MQRSSSRKAAWELDLLSTLSKSGSPGKQAVDYLNKRGGRVSFGPQPTGAKWTLKGMLVGPPDVIINDTQQSKAKSGKDTWTLSIIAHEVKHYQQGLLTALSVYGELEAWQLQLRVLRDLGTPPKHAALQAIEKLKLSHDPNVLREAARLMKEFSPSYRIDLLPLNPVIQI